MRFVYKDRLTPQLQRSYPICPHRDRWPKTLRAKEALMNILLTPIAQMPPGARGFGNRFFVLPRAHADQGRPRFVLGVRIESYGTVLLNRRRARMIQVRRSYAFATGKAQKHRQRYGKGYSSTHSNFSLPDKGGGLYAQMSLTRR